MYRSIYTSKAYACEYYKEKSFYIGSHIKLLINLKPKKCNDDYGGGDCKLVSRLRLRKYWDSKQLYCWDNLLCLSLIFRLVSAI